MTDLENVSFKTLSEVCSFLGNLVESVMDENSTALIVGSTGEITFTRNCLKILSESCCSHPLSKIILNAAVKYCTETGNDCDMLLFLLKEIMLYINCTAKNEELNFRSKLTMELSFFISTLPVIFKTIYDNSVLHAQKSETDFAKFKSDLKSILKSFMQSKFSFSISEVLSSLVFQLIECCSEEWCILYNSLDYLISHFDIACVRVIAPLSESFIVEGFIINHHVTLPHMELENTNYIMVEDLSQGVLFDTSWKINASSFNCELSKYYDQCKKIINYFKFRNIALILSSSASNKILKSTCEDYNIILIDRLSKEEFDYVVLCSGILALSNLTDALEIGNIGVLKTLKHLTCFKSTFVSIKTVTKPHYFIPFSFLLCAQLESLWKEYYVECLNSLKVVKMWFHPFSGNREYQQPIENQPNNEKIGVQINPDFHSLFLDSVHVYQICSKTDITKNNEDDYKLNCTCNNLNVNLTCLALPVGLWEILLQDVLDNFKNCPINLFPTIYKAIDYAYLKFSCLKFNAPFPCSHVQLKTKYLHFQNRMKNKINPFIEPVAPKEILVCHLLHLILQLLKIDQIIKTK